MLQRWTRSRRDDAAAAAAAAVAGPDLSAVPPFPAELDGGLLAVDPAVIGTYIGLPVAAVSPLDGAGAGPTEHPTLGALVVGQQEARKAKLRASGMSEDQIEMVVTTISSAATQHRQHAWSLVFGTGRRASVQVFPLGDGRGDFAGYQARFREQTVGSGHGGRHPILDGGVIDIPEAHYETYRMGGVVVAVGRGHEAVVKTHQFEAPRADLTLAALAALALWAVEG